MTYELTRNIETAGGTVVVKRLMLGDYAKLLIDFKKVPTIFAGWLNESTIQELRTPQYLAQHLPELIGEALPELCGLLALATDKDAEFFEKNIDLDGAANIILAIIDLNDYQSLPEKIKKMWPQLGVTKIEPTPPETSEEKAPGVPEV